MGLINGLRSIIFNVVFFLYTSICFLTMLFACLWPNDKLLRPMISFYCRSLIKIAHWVMGISSEIRGLEHLITDRAIILAPKHQSYMDMLLAWSVCPNLTALAKKEIFRVPVMGILLKKVGIISIDRQSKSAHKGMGSVGTRLQQTNQPLLVYPEGTRVRVGDRKKLKSGAFHLHKDFDLPVVPVATNTGMHWSKGFWHKPGHVIFEIKPALPDGLSKEDFMAQLESVVVERSNELMLENGALNSQ